MPSRCEGEPPPEAGYTRRERTGLDDTHPEARRVQIEIVRRMTIPQRAHLLGEMCETVKTLMMIGLRERHPAASEAEQFRRYAEMRLGRELAERVYGPMPADWQRDPPGEDRAPRGGLDCWECPETGRPTG